MVAIDDRVNALHNDIDINGLDIVLVDDDEDVLHLVQRILGNAGARVRVCSSAAAALGALDEKIPDVLISDLSMPSCDGFQLIRAIRARPAARGGLTPALALSAHAGSAVRAKAIAAGFTTLLTKPMRAITLMEAIAKILGRDPGASVIRALG